MQDIDRCVSVYTAQPDDEHQPWQFFARHRAHYKAIEGISINHDMEQVTLASYIHTDLMFGVKLDSDAPRLLSISSDRTIVSF